MTDPQPQVPLAYQVPPPNWRDVEHLRLLAIFHYIVGGLEALLSSFAIIHLVIGILMLTRPAIFSAPGGAPGPPPAFGWMFAIGGGAVVILGWTSGGLTIYSGRCMATRRHRTPSG